MKILVVDDEMLLVKGIRFNLQNEGYEVITGCNGLEAVALVREQHPGIFRCSHYHAHRKDRRYG